MIGPGSMPRWRPFPKKRTLAYTRARRTKQRRRAPRTGDSATRYDDTVLFDLGHAELPKATLVPKQRSIALVAALERWLLARWTWLVPRTVPVLVAGIGMILMLLSADYLAHAHT